MPSKLAGLALAGAGAFGASKVLRAAFIATPAARRAPARDQVEQGRHLRGHQVKASVGHAAPAGIGSAWVLGLSAAALGAARALHRRQRWAKAVKVAVAASADGVDCKTAFLFPGQGAQSVGMCKELVEECPAAKELFDTASEILGYDLLDRCINGPKEVLDTTVVSQPAIFVASMAAVEKLKQEQGAAVVHEATVTMGLSLGEYSALCFAGALDFEDGVRVTKARGEAMQAAADAVESSMVAVIGLDSEKTEELCKKASADSGKTVKIANYLCKGNYTCSGDKEACAKLVEIAKPEFKARMAVPLAVAGAFHTEFMAPAVEKLRETLAKTPVKSPRIPVISNVDVKAHSDPEEIKETLLKQVTSPVLWEQQMQGMVAGGFEKGFELGPGKVIAGIVKRIDKGAAAALTNVTV